MTDRSRCPGRYFLSWARLTWLPVLERQRTEAFTKPVCMRAHFRGELDLSHLPPTELLKSTDKFYSIVVPRSPTHR